MSTPETIINRQLKELGFLKKGRSQMYCKIDDIIALVCYEHLSFGLCVDFTIYPLFLPCLGIIHFTYGGRLSFMFPDISVLHKEAAEEEKNEYCETAVNHIKYDLLPLVYSLSTAEKLCAFSEKASKPFPFGRRNRLFVRCPPERIKYLFMYSCIYMGEYEKAQKAAKNYIKAMKKCKWLIESLIKEKIIEGEAIIDLLEKGQYQELREKLNKNVEDHIAFFTQPKKRVK